MPQNGQLAAFMAGQLLDGHLLGAPAARAGALLAVIKIAAAGAEQRQSEQNLHAVLHHVRYIADRWQNIRQLGVNQRSVGETHDQPGSVEPGKGERARVKLRAQYPPRLGERHAGDRIGDVRVPAGLLLKLLRDQKSPVAP